MNDHKKALQDIINNDITGNYELAKNESWYTDDLLGSAKHKEDLGARCTAATGAINYADLPTAQADGYDDLDYSRLKPYQKQLELIELAKPKIKGNKTAGGAYTIGGAALILATICAFAGCSTDNDKTRYHQGFPARPIEQPVNAKNMWISGSAFLYALATGAFFFGKWKSK